MAKASVTAFNKNYKGVGGHCINLTVCDDKADPNAAAACARKFVDSNMVATINDTTAFGSKDVATIFADGSWHASTSAPAPTTCRRRWRTRSAAAASARRS